MLLQLQRLREESSVCTDWLVLQEGGTSFARAAKLSVAFLVIHCNSNGAFC